MQVADCRPWAVFPDGSAQVVRDEGARFSRSSGSTIGRSARRKPTVLLRRLTIRAHDGHQVRDLFRPQPVVRIGRRVGTQQRRGREKSFPAERHARDLVQIELHFGAALGVQRAAQDQEVERESEDRVVGGQRQQHSTQRCISSARRAAQVDVEASPGGALEHEDSGAGRIHGESQVARRFRQRESRDLGDGSSAKAREELVSDGARHRS